MNARSRLHLIDASSTEHITACSISSFVDNSVRSQ